PPSPPPQQGDGRTGRRQPLRDLLQRYLGTGDVGYAGRDVPEPDPRLGARGRRLRPVVRKLPDPPDLPGHGGVEPDRFIPVLRSFGRDQLFPGAEADPRDPRQGTGADGGLIAQSSTGGLATPGT